ncbi:MAG TPA: metallophosphoesterase family protein [Vicinamibacterales bacterium]|nr:metallophosphoesterase family protein [Vicinamibacterales bacterium]
MTGKQTRIAALYDIHGNLPALEAVLAEVCAAGADEIIIGGDVVPGPMPRETMALVLDLGIPARHLMGNGDRKVLDTRRGIETAGVADPYREGVRWNARQLRAEDEAAMASWPATLTAHVPGIGGVLFCHATPRNDLDIFTRETPEAALLPLFESVDAALVVCGHTHMQFDRRVGRTRVVNAGSVGMPFGEPGACWLLLGPDIELRRTSYDLEAAADRIRNTGYPDAAEFAAKYVLAPPAEAEILEAFSRAAIK